MNEKELIRENLFFKGKVTSITLHEDMIELVPLNSNNKLIQKDYAEVKGFDFLSFKKNQFQVSIDFDSGRYLLRSATVDENFLKKLLIKLGRTKFHEIRLKTIKKNSNLFIVSGNLFLAGHLLSSQYSSLKILKLFLVGLMVRFLTLIHQLQVFSKAGKIIKEY